jgi:AraC-like DNA-binding protein
MHSHSEALLVLSLRGSATIGTSSEDFELPPGSLLWIAGHTPHRVQTSADHHSLILSFPHELIARATGRCESSGFVHDLIARISQAAASARRERLTAVLVDELAEPVPESTRLSHVSELAARRPALSVASMAREIGMSERAFRRWFLADVGTSFTRWQQERCAQRAISRLQRGDSVKCVAADLGYTSPSAFSAMFKRVMNVTPQHYLRAR